jgi:hypothetical protein
MFASSTFFEEKVTLDGIEYLFRFLWSDRAGSWYVSVMETDGTEIVMGRRVVIGYPLFDGYQDTRLPDGITIALDIEGSGIEIEAQDELGERVRVVYVPVSEFATQPEQNNPFTIEKVV